MRPIEERWKNLLDFSRQPPLLGATPAAHNQALSTREGAIMEDTDLLMGFYLVCRTRNLRPATLKCYADRLHVLLHYAHLIQKSLTVLTRNDFRSYIVTNLERVSPETINGRLRVWKRFYAYLIAEGDIEVSPLEGVDLLRTDTKRPPVLSVRQVDALLRLFDSRDFFSSRNRNIVLVFLDTMIRVGELTRIKISDVDLTQGTIHIHHTKSRRDRIVPISMRTAKSLHSYLRRFRSKLPHPNNGPLFSGQDGGPMSTNAVYLMPQKKQKRLGYDVYPHLLRHTGCTLYLEAGGSMALLQRICGHSDIRVTQRYAHPEDKAIKLDHDRFSPISQIESA